ncbi:MAG: thiamine-phosphate kinase [Candidatus Altiarchaeales archaeon WOR_SM1_79]|nr:MAG: thiamine-phosphate kinase [Candidatus Altiarchaeales archaeon WOR_SM1_79]
MKLSDLGERKLIERMGELLDIGDDAACIKIGDGFLVVSTDMIYRKTHILNEMSFAQAGHKIVSMCFSDIASMGAKPAGFLLSYGSADIDFADFDELIKGAKEQAERYGAGFIGGDTNETDELTLAGTALGFADKPVFRKGAKPGEVVGVTSDLGSAALGVKVLLEKMVPLSEIPADILQRTLDPEPRVREGILLGNYASAMMDISDSLAVSLHEIAERSSAG